MIAQYNPHPKLQCFFHCSNKADLTYKRRRKSDILKKYWNNSDCILPSRETLFCRERSQEFVFIKKLTATCPFSSLRYCRTSFSAAKAHCLKNEKEDNSNASKSHLITHALRSKCPGNITSTPSKTHIAKQSLCETGENQQR